MSDKDKLEQMDNETKAKGFFKLYISGSILSNIAQLKTTIFRAGRFRT
jgi:hypothetical protein